MPISVLLLLLGTAHCQLPADINGTLSGKVVNISRGRAPAGRTEVLLQVQVGDKLHSVKEVISDDQGDFTFTGLPTGRNYHFLPGANRNDIYYPGPRVQLTLERAHAQVELQVCDILRAPSPLVIERHEITICPRVDSLQVEESLTIVNPTNRCYVGTRNLTGQEPVTLHLAIPNSFEKVTFQTEFFGRHFNLINGQLATDIPWPPGRRKIKFTYVQPIRSSRCTWERPLDLPCRHLRLFVETASPQTIECNLPQVPGDDSNGTLFELEQATLPAGHTVRIELKDSPLSIITVGRWLAVGILVVLSCAAIGVVTWRANERNGSCLPTQKRR